MKGPDAGPETGAPEWSRPQRASEPLPPPPSGYKFAGPDYLYAPRQEEEAPAAPAPTEAAATTSAPASAPAMVWSEARSTWEPAAPSAPAPPPRGPAPSAPAPPLPAPLRPNWSRSKPRRRFKGRWVITILVGFVVVNRFLAGLHGALSDDGGPPLGVPSPAYSAVPSPTSTTEPTTRPTTEPSVTPPPAVLTTLADVLGAQVAGVRAGNRAWFLRTVDPKATAALDTYRRMFANLQALHAAGFIETSAAGGGPIKVETSFRVTVSFCVGGRTTPCALSSDELGVRVGPLGQGVAIESVTQVADFTRVAPPPWLATPLTVRAAGNVLVAASPTTQAQIAKVLPVAENAAAAADQYSPDGPPPNPYVVYLAGHADVTAWFGDTGRISHGVVDPPIGLDQVALVLPDATRAAPRGGDGLAADLQRALAHMALTNNDNIPLPVDTFSTGLAEYAAYDQLAPQTAADALAPIANYLHNGGWNHSCFYSSQTASPAGMAAMPAVGLVAIRYLVASFGFYYAFSFWNAVERMGEPPQNASLEMFQMSWSDVDSECADSVLGAAGP